MASARRIAANRVHWRQTRDRYGANPLFFAQADSLRLSPTTVDHDFSSVLQPNIRTFAWCDEQQMKDALAKHPLLQPCKDPVP
jgi:hypothetical protein